MTRANVFFSASLYPLCFNLHRKYFGKGWNKNKPQTSMVYTFFPTLPAKKAPREKNPFLCLWHFYPVSNDVIARKNWIEIKHTLWIHIYANWDRRYCSSYFEILKIEKHQLRYQAAGWQVERLACTLSAVNGVIFLATQLERNLRQTPEKIYPGKSVRNAVADLNERIFHMYINKWLI